MAVAINARTSLSQLHEEYRRCCGYDIDASVEDARQFLRVCRALLSPQFGQEIEHGGRSGSSRMVVSVEDLRKGLDDVKAWLTANDPNFTTSIGGGGVVHASNREGWRD